MVFMLYKIQNISIISTKISRFKILQLLVPTRKIDLNLKARYEEDSHTRR